MMVSRVQNEKKNNDHESKDYILQKAMRYKKTSTIKIYNHTSFH